MKDNSGVKSHAFRLALTDQQRIALKVAAAKADISVGEYVSNLIARHLAHLFSKDSRADADGDDAMRSTLNR